MSKRIVAWSVDHPKRIILLTAIVTALFLLQLPGMQKDTDPKHMLPATSPVRVYNDQVEGWFELHPDVIVLGIVNDRGVFNPETLGRIARLTQEAVKLPGVIARDVLSFTTVDTVIASDGSLAAHPILEQIPRTQAELAALRQSVLDNPLFVERLVSKDATATAIYIPIEATADGKEIADRLRVLLRGEQGEERYYLAGDPVARDTFGAEMFKQMGLFSPIAGMVMFVALFLMFRNLTIVLAGIIVAMLSVIWSMGLLVGLGIAVHIMSSMIPVFLMAISTDSVHIFNEFGFRFKELGDKRTSILETMRVVGPPVIYSDLTTAAGFASLAVGGIIPVRVFGLFVAFGTLVILLMSFTFIPALLALISEDKLHKLSAAREPEERRASPWLWRLGRLSLYRRKAVVVTGLVLFLLAVAGIAQIRGNNNMVSWFKAKSEVRQADAMMNQRLGGTSTAYLVAVAQDEEAMKRPEVLREIEGVQQVLAQLPVVGKTTSLVDVVKRVNRVLHDDDPRFEVIPASAEEIGQYLFLFSMAAKPRDLNNLVDYPFQKANIWLQLKSWDAVVMREVLQRLQAYTAAHPLPGVNFQPAGIAYFNMVWNDEVLWGMLHGFMVSLVLVLLLLIVDFRSWRWGLVSFLPLLFTIVVIYGAVGWVGKDFDMPISVLSTLSLGMAIDFAIHFVGRFRPRYAESMELEKTLLWTVARPGKGVVRNALLFALGFSSMVLADLTPYITVGVFMAAIMLLSSLATLLFLPALIALFPGWLLGKEPGRLSA